MRHEINILPNGARPYDFFDIFTFFTTGIEALVFRASKRAKDLNYTASLSMLECANHVTRGR